jgi:hypothetical protein
MVQVAFIQEIPCVAFFISLEKMPCFSFYLYSPAKEENRSWPREGGFAPVGVGRWQVKEVGE